MRSDLVVVSAPLLDAHLRLRAMAEPLQRQVLISERPVEGFVGAVLPRLARVNERHLNLGRLQPAENGPCNELLPVVRAQVAWSAMDAHQLRQDLDDPPGPNPAGDIDRQALARELVDDRQALQGAPVGARVEHEIVRPHVIVELASVHRVLEIVRTAINWRRAQKPPVLFSSPFHRFGVTLNKKDEASRDRRLSLDEENRLLDTALQRINTAEHQFAGLLHDRLIGALELCCRRGEMLLIQNRRVYWDTHQISIPGSTAKGPRKPARTVRRGRTAGGHLEAP